MTVVVGVVVNIIIIIVVVVAQLLTNEKSNEHDGRAIARDQLTNNFTKQRSCRDL